MYLTFAYLTSHSVLSVAQKFAGLLMNIDKGILWQKESLLWEFALNT
jgi:hypothetical protein